MAFDAGAVIGRLELNIAGWQQSVQTVIDRQKELDAVFKAGVAPIGQFADLLKQYGLQTAPQSAAMVEKLRGQQTQLDAAYKSGLINLGAYQKGSQDVANQLKELEGVTERAKSKTELFNEKMAQIGPTMKTVGRTFTVVGGAIVASFGAMIKKTADYGDELNDLSKRTGIAVGTLSGLKLAVDKSGASMEALAIGLRGLANAMNAANSGNKEAAARFDALGISVTNTDGTLRDVNDVMFDVSDRFAEMEDGAQKTTLAQDLFGKSGMALIPTLNLGSAGLKKEREEAEKLGLVMSQEAATACDEFNDSLTELAGGLQGVAIQIGQALMPAIKNLVEGITRAIIKVIAWIKSHEDLTRILAMTTLALGGVLAAIGPMLYMLPGLVKGWQTLAAVLKLSTAGLAASVVGLTAVVAAAAVAYDIVTRLTKATNEATDADYAAFEANQALGQKLREVADAAGLTREQFHQLSLKYDENNAAMAMAIKRGTEGKALQEALVTVGKEHAAVIDEQKKKMAEMDPVTRALQDAMSKLGKETKTLAEQLDITFRADTETRIKKLNDALLLYRGKLTAEQVDKIRKEIDDLSKSLRVNLAPSADEVAKHVDAALAKLEEMALKAMREIDKASDYTVDDMDKALDEIAKGWKKVPDGAKQAADTTDGIWESTTDEMAKAFGEAFASILKDGLNFSNLMKALFQGMVNAVATLVGKQLTKAFEEALKFIVGKTASAMKTAAASVAVFVAAVLIIPEAIKTVGELFDWLGGKWDELIGTVTETVWDPTEGMEEWEKAIWKIQDFLVGYQISLKEVEDSWSALLGWAKRVGQEGSQAIVQLIKAFRVAGKESRALNEYMQSWLKTVPDAILVLVHSIDVFITSTRKATSAIIDMFKGSTDAQKKNTKELKKSLDEIGRLAILTFNSMMASGMSFYEAINAMSDSIYALRAEYKKLGMEAPMEFKKLFRIVGLTKAHKELFEAIDATRQIMIALGNSAWLTADAWTTLTGQAVKQFHLLRHHGFSVQDSLRAMAPTLQAIVNYAHAYGYELDAQTQSLVNQAMKMGLIHEAQMTQEELQAHITAGAEASYKVLVAIAKVLGADISGAMGGINDKMGLLNLKGESFAGTGTKADETWKTAMANMAEGAKKAYEILLLIAKVLGVDIKKSVDSILESANDFIDAGVRVGKTWVNAAVMAKKAWGGFAFPTVNIPHFAGGGIAYTPQLAQLAEHEPEVVSHLADYRAGNLPGAGMGAGGQAVNHYSINIQAIDGPSVERLFKGKGREIIDDMFRQNKGGLTRHVNKWLDAMA